MLSRFAQWRFGKSFGNKSCAPGTACPWHDGFLIRGGADDAFDKAGVGFHRFIPLTARVLALLPCHIQYGAGFRRVFDCTERIFEEFDGSLASFVAIVSNSRKCLN